MSYSVMNARFIPHNALGGNVNVVGAINAVCASCGAIDSNRAITLRGKIYHKCSSCAATAMPVPIRNWGSNCYICTAPFGVVPTWMVCGTCCTAKCLACVHRLGHVSQKNTTTLCICGSKNTHIPVNVHEPIAHARHFAFIQLLITITPDIFIEYCKWIRIKHKYQHAEPPTILGALWKTHMVYTVQYREFCNDVVGAFVDNDASINTSTIVTLLGYNILFGQNYGINYTGLRTVHVGVWSILDNATGFIYIKDVVTHLCVLPVKSTMTIDEVKKWYGLVHSFSTEKGLLMFAGAYLGGDGRLCDYQITCGDVLGYITE